jgi:dTDP-4-dehydrorhamnose 3,5-epimerase-like enzyme
MAALVMIETSGHMETNELQPRIINGGLHVDARGTVSFVNDFDFKGVDRFYTIRAHRPQELRGWVGHQREHKWFFAVQGTTLIAVVKPDRWDCPSSSLPVERFVLSAAKPQVLHVPSGHVTGSVNLSADAILMVFSSGKIEDAKTDDYRFAVDTWLITE